MSKSENLANLIKKQLSHCIEYCGVVNDQVTVELQKQHLYDICLAFRDMPEFKFEQLVDLCGVDYLHYGVAEWCAENATTTGFSRAVDEEKVQVTPRKARFGVVYHLLSITHNHRVRLRTYLDEEPLLLDSVVDVWASANWYEREAFDLYGILFSGHPDLRRILTDYGFIGHPFRKDFPLIGNVEMRYDKTSGRCIYEPVSIQPRTLVPKVIREDNRYLDPHEHEEEDA